MPQLRQLAAIMFTDIVGYTELMGDDEQRAFELLNKNRLLQKPLIEQYNGKWIKELGDGVLATFSTVTDAVNCACSIIKGCEQVHGLKLRIGIHQAEVIFENNDVFGDGVNIAARLQSIASIGGICISETVRNNIANNKKITTSFIKEETLKHVKEPVRIYEVVIENNQVEEKGSFNLTTVKITSDKSIAVLPFVNMSSDPEQEFFSDGISEEVINVLAQVPQLKVAGRTSSFSFKGKNQDLRIIGEQLNVKFILEGSVRKSGNKLRITAQLINASDGYHLWTARYDREISDIFDIQDEISLSILNELKVKLFGDEKDKVLKRHTENAEAYQLYLQGRFHYNRWAGGDGYKKAIGYYNEAIKNEPNYALAYSGLAACYLNLWFFSHLPREESLSKMKEATLRSLEIDDEIAESHLSLARMKFWYEWDFQKAEQEFKKAIELNPNHAEAHEQYGMMLGILARKNDALEQAKKALALDPFSLMINWGVGWINWMLGNYERSIEQGRRLIEFEPNFYGGHLILGYSLLITGKYEEAVVEFKFAVTQNYGSFTLFFLGWIYGIMKEKEKANNILKQLLDMSKVQPVGNYEIGLIYASLNENDTAIHYLEQAFEKHEGPMVFLKLYSQLIPSFKSDPRLVRLLERIGLPDK